ncbi:WD40-repeat-containing domain protein [Hysterangium stoloniferum]|nr:WD40-repeat-containing domain protein [Hysterangium stoloniferum]
MIQTNLIQNAHADLVCDAVYDFYGTRLATAGLDQRIKIWRLDEHTGEWSVEDEWKAHDAAICKLSWAHPQHGQFIASSSFDRTVRIWERAPPDTGAMAGDHGLNGIGAGAGAGATERWVERVMLPEAKGSVRSVQWAPKNFGMKVASISSDNHLRLYECLESGSNTTNAPTSLNWSLIEDVDIPSLASSSALQLDSSPAADAASLTAPIEPAPGQGGSGSTSPYMGTSTLVMTNNATSRPGGGNREADGGWDLSWCKEAYWGEVCAVAAGTSGLVKIVHFPSAQRPRAVLVLGPPPPGSKPHSPTPPRDREGSSYAHPRRDPHVEQFAVTTVAWAPSCGRSYHLIATGGRDGRVKIWKVRSPEKDKEEESESDDGRGVAAVAAGWSAGLVADFNDHNGPIGRVAWNVTGTVLTSAGNDGCVRLWRSTYGNVWRAMGSLDVVQGEDTPEGGAVVAE